MGSRHVDHLSRVFELFAFRIQVRKPSENTIQQAQCLAWSSWGLNQPIHPIVQSVEHMIHIIKLDLVRLPFESNSATTILLCVFKLLLDDMAIGIGTFFDFFIPIVAIYHQITTCFSPTTLIWNYDHASSIQMTLSVSSWWWYYN